jgi:Holliday junction resolvasome RuvABC endonuclease subunit
MASGNRAHQIGEWGGVLRLALYDHLAQPIVEVPPSSLKKYLTGRGNADKDLMLSTATRRFDRVLNNDEADALALWAMAMDAYGHPVIQVPQAHRKALDVIQWPQVAPWCSTIIPGGCP